jgi:hypothetical protein
LLQGVASATDRRAGRAFLFAVPEFSVKISSNRVELGVCEDERTQPKKAAVIVSETTIEMPRKSILSLLKKTDATKRSSAK